MSLIITIVLVIVIILIFLWVRNNWVYKKRLEMIDRDLVEYHNALSYYQMLFRFWVWDIEKFNNKNQRKRK